MGASSRAEATGRPVPLSVLRTPVKVRVPGHFIVVGLVVAGAARAVDRTAGVKVERPPAQRGRTRDLDPCEDRGARTRQRRYSRADRHYPVPSGGPSSQSHGRRFVSILLRAAGPACHTDRSITVTTGALPPVSTCTSAPGPRARRGLPNWRSLWGDQMGTTRYAHQRTTRMSRVPTAQPESPVQQRKRLPARSGGQGVADSKCCRPDQRRAR
jgi:hypothetical protein